MRWTTWTLFLAALVLLVGVGTMVSRQSRVTPQEFFEEVEKRIADGRYDREQTLLNLDQVLERSRDAGDADLEARVLRRRGRISMELGAWDRARNDLLAVALYRPGDSEIEADLVELETQAGDFAAAEARVRRGLELDPNSPDAWERLGRLHRLAAAKHESTALELLSRALAPDEMLIARENIRRSVALDPGDVARPALAERVRELLHGTDERVLQDVLRACDRASEEMAQARDGYAHALAIEIKPRSLAALLELFGRAGRDDLAADLASVTLKNADVRVDVEVTRALLGSLERLGRFRFASELAAQWTRTSAPLDVAFLEQLARIGLHAEKGELLTVAGRSMLAIGTADVALAGHFFHGLGLVRNGQNDIGRDHLRRFVSSAAPDPVPGARAMAWRAIAQASRALSEPEFEREALQGAIDLEPGFDGELQLRIAELLMVAPHGGYRIPEARFAQAMSLMPERTEELLPRWHEIGERELKSIDFDPVAVRAGLLRNSVWRPASDATPYELFRLAEIHHAAGDDGRARAHLERLLQIVPGFLPALDLQIEVVKAQGDRAQILRTVAARVASGGRTEATTEVLREVPLDELDSRDQHDLMRADPEYFGRIVAASTLARQGRLRPALAVLQTIAPESLGDEARVLAARLDLEAGRPERAWALLEPMGANLLAAPDALELAVRAACFTGADEQVHGLLARSANARNVGRARRLALVDTALNDGQFAAARELLRSLDSAAATRGGDVCTRLAIAATAVGDAPDWKRSLARAEAFDTRGGRERAALAIAIQTGRTDEWKSLAERAATTTPSPDPLYVAALLTLQGRDDEARTRVRRALDGERPADARWSILARALPPDADGQLLAADPRLGALLANEVDTFVNSFEGRGGPRAAAAWVATGATAEGLPLALAALRARLATASTGAPTTFLTWLSAAAAARVGDRGQARAGAMSVLARAPDCEPAWDLREALDPEMALDPVIYGRFRGERNSALQTNRRNGDSPTMTSREDLSRALAASGQHEAAVLAADALPEGTQPSSELTAIAGRSLLALRRARPAVERLTRALSASPPPRDVHGAIGDLLAAVDAAESGDEPLPRAESQRVLADLAQLYPNDPRLVLAMARIDLEIDRRNPVLGVRRAIARLERHRANNQGRGLDAFGPGAAAAWIEFLARLDTASALELAREELDLEPGSMPTWLAAALVHEARGDRDRALSELRLASRIVDRGEVSREILRLRSEADIDVADIDASIAHILALENRPVPDAELRVLAARGFLNLGPRLAFRALEAARAAHADPLARVETRAEAALLLSLGMLARVRTSAGEEDIPGYLDEVGSEPPSRIQDDFVRVLRGLAGASAGS